MGFVGNLVKDVGGVASNLLGGGNTGTGSAGMNYNPTMANVIQPTDLSQIQNAYGQSQQGLAQQLAFLQALQGQNGIANQSNVYNQLAGIAAGTGPNPAQAMLNNTTGQNVATQGALMASQRGASSNPALIARQAALQGANTQQQAAGQAAALQAQQSLGALGQMGSLAGQQVGQQAQAGQFYNQAAQSEQQNLLNALSGYNNANVNAQGNVNTVSGNLANNIASQQGSGLSGIVNGLGAGIIGKAHGGMIGYADGGMAPTLGNYTDFGSTASQMPGQPSSGFGQFLFSSAPSQTSAQTNPISQAPMGQNANQNVYDAGKTAGGGLGSLIKTGIGLLGFEEGGSVDKVPGKAQVKGDSYKNDTVPALLSPGEVVIPRHVMQSDDPVANAAKFVAAVMAKHGGGLK